MDESIFLEYKNSQIDLMNTSEWMLWWDKKGDTSWLWLLNPINERQTRLSSLVYG